MSGSIRRREKGTWELTVDLGRDEHGGRRRKFVNVKGKKGDAERVMRELLASAEKGLPMDSSKLTVAQYLDCWYKDYVQANTRPRTADRYQDDIRNHLVPHFGHTHLNKVLPADVQRMESALLSEGLSPRSAEHANRVLSQAFKHAVQWGLNWRNPCDSVRPPRKVYKEINIPDVATVLRLLELSKETPHFAAIHFLAYTGARRGEACGLMWRDVDLERGVVSIRQAATKPRGYGLVMAAPKTAKGRRAVTLDTDTVDVLRAHRGTQLVQEFELGSLYRNQGYVFTTLNGSPLNPDMLTYAWHRIAVKAGLPHIRLHDLRHFHASLLLQAGTNPKVVQERLGHSTIAVSLDVYSHVVPGIEEKAASAFADIMNSRSGEAGV